MCADKYVHDTILPCHCVKYSTEMLLLLSHSLSIPRSLNPHELPFSLSFNQSLLNCSTNSLSYPLSPPSLHTHTHSIGVKTLTLVCGACWPPLLLRIWISIWLKDLSLGTLKITDLVVKWLFICVCNIVYNLYVEFFANNLHLL